MVMANQAGWMIPNPIDFTVCWNGGGMRQDLWFNFGGGQPIDQFSFQVAVGASENQGDHRISSHFGNGIVTFEIPYVFRTPSDINLWVKGPSNYIKDGACALEGIVETDWLASTFTMNWKLTRPGLVVEFKRSEPICMIVPIPRGLAESLSPEQALITTNPKLDAEHRAWHAGRKEFIEYLRQNRSTTRGGWEKDYFQGRSQSGDYVEGHQTQISLKEFVVQPS
jgi:Family of unknown function (DUF6065)